MPVPLLEAWCQRQDGALLLIFQQPLKLHVIFRDLIGPLVWINPPIKEAEGLALLFTVANSIHLLDTQLGIGYGVNERCLRILPVLRQ
jgi:hypothetical protein